MKALDHQKKNLVLILLKQHKILFEFTDNSHLFVDGKKTFKFKADNKNVNFPTQFCLGNI